MKPFVAAAAVCALLVASGPVMAGSKVQAFRTMSGSASRNFSVTTVELVPRYFGWSFEARSISAVDADRRPDLSNPEAGRNGCPCGGS